MKTAQPLVEVRLLLGLPCTREAALLARSYLLPCPACSHHTTHAAALVMVSLSP